jgi:hypothetical protein
MMLVPLIYMNISIFDHYLTLQYTSSIITSSPWQKNKTPTFNIVAGNGSFLGTQYNDMNNDMNQ